MRLDQELVRRKLCESRTEAQELIATGAVFLCGAVCTKQTKQINEADVLEVTSRRQFVSRGGDKLQGVLLDIFSSDIKQFPISNFQFSTNSDGRAPVSDGGADEVRTFLEGKTALDIGSSTGGFTDCLLSYGVIHVDAVDVGTAQLHSTMRADTRVTSYENTDIRTFKPRTNPSYDIIVADLSFIPLGHVFSAALALGKSGTIFILLIKPQFEVGKGNTKKGIVKEENLVTGILAKYKLLVEEKGLVNVEIFASRIQGSGGNQEYFLYGVLDKQIGDI